MSSAWPGVYHLLRNTNDLETSAIDAVDKVRALHNERGNRNGIGAEERDEGQQDGLELSNGSALSQVERVVCFT